MNFGIDYSIISSFKENYLSELIVQIKDLLK
jgi:hypothetical protein